MDYYSIWSFYGEFIQEMINWIDWDSYGGICYSNHFVFHYLLAIYILHEIFYTTDIIVKLYAYQNIVRY